MYRLLSEFSYPSDRIRPIYDGGRIYSGDIWSDDHRFCYKVKDGHQAGWILYHSNGNPAMITDSAGQNPALCDESGKILTTEWECQQWLNKYRATYLLILNKALDVIKQRTH